MTWGKTKTKISVVGNEKRQLEDKWPAYASHQLLLCYFLKIADLAFLICEVCRVLKLLRHWEKQVYCSQLCQAKEQGACNYFVGLKKFERWYLAGNPLSLNVWRSFMTFNLLCYMQNLKFFLEIPLGPEPLRGSCVSEIQVMKGRENSVDGYVFWYECGGSTSIIRRLHFHIYLI